MEALQFNPKEKTLRLVSLPKPKITAGDEIIIEVAYAGMCGTDIHIMEGEFCCSDQPFSPGHEFSGVVREIGPSVTHVKPGDHVVLDPQSWCTTCEFCRTAKYHLCTSGGVENATGIRTDGGWAKYAKARARQVYKLPDSLDLSQGALCEPLSCIVWGLERGIGKTPIGQDILVVGAGIIGNLWCSVLHHLGHRKVTVVEPFQQRRDINQRLDTGYVCLTPEELSGKLDSDKVAFDVAIDCSGNGRAIEMALRSLRCGGVLCVFGVASPDTEVRISPYQIFKRELTIIGTIINPFSMHKAIRMMEAMGRRYITFEKLGIQEFQMKNYAEALAKLKEGHISKVVFTINPTLQ